MPFIRKNSPLSSPSIVIGGADPAGHTFKSTIIVNSGVMRVGDVVGVVSGAGVANSIVVRRYNASGNQILGICQGFGREDGSVVAFDSGTADTVTVGAANETTGGRIFAKVDITPGTVWSAPLSAAIHGTAVFGAGFFIDPDTGANAGRLLETSITATAATNTRAFACWGPDPEDTTRGLVTVAESILNGLITATS